jgi:hypothetical protein
VIGEEYCLGKRCQRFKSELTMCLLSNFPQTEPQKKDATAAIAEWHMFDICARPTVLTDDQLGHLNTQ